MSDRLAIGVPASATERSAGALAASAWLTARKLPRPAAAWNVAIALDVVDQPASPTVTSPAQSRFHIAIAASEWGFLFWHCGRTSWIRVTDVAFVHERDDHALLRRVPPLRDVGSLVHTVEQRHGIAFQRRHASVRTDLVGAEPEIRSWITAAL